MRILHTSDWHLGRQFHGLSLDEDHDHILVQILAVIDDERPDVVIIAGDVFVAVCCFIPQLRLLFLDLLLPGFFAPQLAPTLLTASCFRSDFLSINDPKVGDAQIGLATGEESRVELTLTGVREAGDFVPRGEDIPLLLVPVFGLTIFCCSSLKISWKDLPF